MWKYYVYLEHQVVLTGLCSELFRIPAEKEGVMISVMISDRIHTVYAVVTDITDKEIRVYVKK